MQVTINEEHKRVKKRASPDTPSRHHLRRYLRSLLLAAYCLYASVVAPRRLASNTLPVMRVASGMSGA